MAVHYKISSRNLDQERYRCMAYTSLQKYDYGMNKNLPQPRSRKGIETKHHSKGDFVNSSSYGVSTSTEEWWSETGPFISVSGLACYEQSSVIIDRRSYCVVKNFSALCPYSLAQSF